MSPDLDRTTQCAPQLKSPLRTALRDVYSGFVGLTHNGMAIAGMLLATVVITLSARPDLRQVGERELLTWLQYRQEAEMSTEQVATIIAEPGAAERATALIPTNLPKQQANVAYWLSKKYRVAPEPLGVLVAEAFNVGERVRLDPTLLLAVMAIESRFNPFAQSPVGAQGLMQVLTKVHTDKYEDFGGLRPGVQSARRRESVARLRQASRFDRRRSSPVCGCSFIRRQRLHQQSHGGTSAHSKCCIGKAHAKGVSRLLARTCG
jgi:hypothetical protein